jgi:hypothetical protein
MQKGVLQLLLLLLLQRLPLPLPLHLLLHVPKTSLHQKQVPMFNTNAKKFLYPPFTCYRQLKINYWEQ